MDDKDHINRLLQEHGTSGLAALIASVCRENAETDDEPGMREFWNNEAQLFENGFNS